MKDLVVEFARATAMLIEAAAVLVVAYGAAEILNYFLERDLEHAGVAAPGPATGGEARPASKAA